MKNLHTRLRSLHRHGTLCALLLLQCLASCRKDLCYDHDVHGNGYRIQITASWEREWERDYGEKWPAKWNATTWGTVYDDLRPGIPDGLAVVIYTDGGNDASGSRASLENEHHLLPEGGQVYLGEESCSLLLYNDDTEYIVFNDMASLPSATATTRTRTRASYSMAEAHTDEHTVSPPDMLYGAFLADYKVPFQPGWQELPVMLRPLTYTYLVRYEFERGLEYVELARGALAGMAESVYLQDGRTAEQAATLLFDCTLTSYGAEARVLSFGVPAFPDSYYTSERANETKRTHGLQLEMRLSNGKMVTREFDISDQMARQPRGGVIIVKGINITEEEGKAGGSAFDVNVEGWGKYQDIDIPL